MVRGKQEMTGLENTESEKFSHLRDIMSFKVKGFDAKKKKKTKMGKAVKEKRPSEESRV